MVSNQDKRRLKELRKLVEKEKKKLRITEPKFTIQMDSRTKKICLSYSIPVDKGVDGKKNRIIRKKQTKMYLRNITLDDTETILINLPNYANRILSEMDIEYKSIGGDGDSVSHWSRVYTENPKRKGNFEVSQVSLKGDRYHLDKLIGYLEEHNRPYLNVWKWVDDGRDVMMEYLRYKQEVGGEKKKWSDGSVMSSYSRIRAFFNYVSDNLKGFPPNLLNRLPVKPSKVETMTFNSMEMEIVLQFIKEKEEDPQWSWFIPILQVLLETGMRVSEVVSMKIRDIDINEKKIKILGKGRNGGKERFVYLRSEPVWKIICCQIYNEEGKVRTDKEYVFHQRYYGISYGKWYLMEDKSKGFTSSGVQHKFKDMVVELKLNPKLSTHSTRRYFITEMLKKSSGNIPLVAQLVGHNTWDVVKMYTKNVVDENTDVNVGVI
jgi:site-specific recombinase XerD